MVQSLDVKPSQNHTTARGIIGRLDEILQTAPTDEAAVVATATTTISTAVEDGNKETEAELRGKRTGREAVEAMVLSDREFLCGTGFHD